MKPKGAKVIVKKVSLSENKVNIYMHDLPRKTNRDNIGEEIKT